MKHGYTCKCGWRLKRAKLTRPQYAAKKNEHAFEDMLRASIIDDEVVPGCIHLRKELEQSRRSSL